MASDQAFYHLQERAIQHAVLPWCERHDVAVVAYSPFGHGPFPDLHTPGGRVLKQIADAHGATPSQGRAAILGAAAIGLRNSEGFAPEHVEENAGALQLTEAEIADRSGSSAGPSGERAANAVVAVGAGPRPAGPEGPFLPYAKRHQSKFAEACLWLWQAISEP